MKIRVRGWGEVVRSPLHSRSHLVVRLREERGAIRGRAGRNRRLLEKPDGRVAVNPDGRDVGRTS